MPSPKTCVIVHKYENTKYKTNEIELISGGITDCKGNDTN